MITRALNLRRSGSRRPRPSRFPTPGFPRGESRGRWAASRPPRAFFLPRSPHHVRSGGIGADLFAALVMVGGIFMWGSLLALLAGSQ